MIIILQVVKETDETCLYYSCLDDKPIIERGEWVVSFPSERLNQVSPINSNKAVLIQGDVSCPPSYDKYIVNCSLTDAVKIMNGEKEWQNENYTFTEVERVYATRIDATIVPDGVRQAA